MAYVICEKCGGHYELEEGESLEDFDTCQCGGSLKYANGTERFSSDLKYVEKDPQMVKENEHQEVKESNRPKLVCSNCMKENEGGIFCSKCGGKLITVGKSKRVDLEESKELEKLSYSAFGKDRYVSYNHEEPKDFLSRINWLGVFAGVGFLVVSLFLSALIFVFSLFSKNPYGYPDYSGFVGVFIIFILLSCLLAIAAGGLTVFIGKIRNYDDGIINGFLVGLISSVILGILSGPSTILIGIVIYGALTAFGGAISVFVRKQLYK